jgi:uncharacterized BrkB/YihY/UPF0761 family membrane protein
VAWDVFAFIARWALGVGCLALAVGLLVRIAPATSQPLPWVSLGTAIVTAWWVIVSVGFYFYLTGVAAYGSAFGSLASVIVAMAYLYISTTAFLFGAQLDAIIRAQATGMLSGAEVDRRTVAGPPLTSPDWRQSGKDDVDGLGSQPLTTPPGAIRGA